MSFPPLSRRAFLRLGGLSATLSALSACLPLPGSPGAAHRRGNLWGKSGNLAAGAQDPLLHLLRRTTFGPTARELAVARDMGRDSWLEAQLQAPPDDPPPVQAALDRFPSLRMDPAELADLDDPPRIARELVAATLIRQFLSPNQLFETMADFWTNHFNIYLRDGPVVIFKGLDDREVIRRHALGKFPDMLRASARSPAMLLYLDNARSQAPSPNENYARELLELHSVGVAAGYSHHDVEEVARVFTGWSLSPLRGGGDGSFAFRSSWHDRGDKHVMELHLESAGEAEGDRLLDYLAGHPATARHIAAKLCRRFVSDAPSDTLVSKVAEVYAATRGDIPDMLRAIFSSAGFNAAAGFKLKRALDFFVSCLRVATTGEGLGRPVFSYLQLLGQVPFAWPAPDGYPEYAAAWTNTNQTLYRWNLALSLTAGDFAGVQLDLPELRGNPDSWVVTMSDHVLGAALPDPARTILVEAVSGLAADEATSVLAGLVLASPYFQIR